MQLKHFIPDKRLQHLVKHYWLLTVPGCDIEDKVHSFFPLDAMEIIFHLKEPFLRLEKNSWIPEAGNFIEGQQSGIINVKQKGPMKTIGITLHPWASTFFYHTSPPAFTNDKFDAAAIDKKLSDLHSALAANQQDELIPGLCDQYFLAKLEQCKKTFSAADQLLISLMSNSTNEFHPKNIRGQWSFSLRYFEQKCLHLLGVPAGEILKKRRMKKVLDISLSEQFISFTDVAHSAGYYDQAHFIKDFKFYFNKPPMAFFRADNACLKTFL